MTEAELMALGPLDTPLVEVSRGVWVRQWYLVRALPRYRREKDTMTVAPYAPRWVWDMV